MATKKNEQPKEVAEKKVKKVVKTARKDSNVAATTKVDEHTSEFEKSYAALSEKYNESYKKLYKKYEDASKRAKAAEILLKKKEDSLNVAKVALKAAKEELKEARKPWYKKLF